MFSQMPDRDIDVVLANTGFSVLTPVIGHPEPGVYEFTAVAVDPVRSWRIDFGRMRLASLSQYWSADPIQSWRIDFDPIQVSFTVTPLERIRQLEQQLGVTLKDLPAHIENDDTPIAGYWAKVLPEIWALEWPNGEILAAYSWRRFARREELLEWWQNYIHELNDDKNYVHENQQPGEDHEDHAE
jgi:hypothetical protein